MKKGLIAFFVVIIVLIVGSVGWYFSIYNNLVTLEESVSSAWSEIDNQLLRRADLIPNLVNTVKGYAAQEKDIFENIANARAGLLNAQGPQEKINASNELDSAISRLLMVVENYPDLKSDSLFIQLMDELSGTENRLAVARKRYNDSVREFNTKIRTFPAKMIANNNGYESKPYFEIPAASRENPQVNF